MVREEETIRENLRAFGRCATPMLPPSAPQASAVANASDNLELTDELLRSLIEGKSFQTTPIHTYPVQRSHFQSSSRACNASRWKVFPLTPCNPSLCQQQRHRYWHLVVRAHPVHAVGALISKGQLERMASRAGLGGALRISSCGSA